MPRSGPRRAGAEPRRVRLSASLFPALAFFLCAVCLYFYRIDKSLELEMSRELNQRRSAFLPDPVPSPVPSAP